MIRFFQEQSLYRGVLTFHFKELGGDANAKRKSIIKESAVKASKNQ
jgi:hypothetical protein